MPLFLRVLALISCLVVSQLAVSGQGAMPSARTNPKPATKLFAVEVTGKGKPMILIPGLISSGDVWKGTVAHYASTYQCHVLTLAGFAGQPASDATPFLFTVRDEIATYIRQHKLDKPVIVGHSLGGFLALALAANNPDLVGKLVIVDGLPAPGAEGNPNATAEELKAAADRAATSYARTDAAARRQMIATMARRPEDVGAIAAWDDASDRATATRALAETISSDLRADLARIKSPALVLATWVGQATSVDQEYVERTFRSQFMHMKTWQLEVAPKSRHFIMYDEPDWMFAKMDKFLGQ